MANNTTSAVGLFETDVVFGDDGLVTGQAGTSGSPNLTESVATNVGAGTSDTATADAEITAQVGIYSSPITIGDQGTVTGNEYAALIADASSIEGVATASAVFSGLTGTGTSVTSTGAIIDQTNELITPGTGSSAGSAAVPGVRHITFSFTGTDSSLSVNDEVSVGLGGVIYTALVTSPIAGSAALISAIASTINASGSGTGTIGSGGDAGSGLTAFFSGSNTSPYAVLDVNGGDLTVAAGTGTLSSTFIIADDNSNPTSGLVSVTDQDGTPADMAQSSSDVLVTSFVAAVGSSSGSPAVYGPGNDDDIVIGDNGLINAFADNLADADASSISGNADATAEIVETYGMLNIDVEVGDNGVLNASAVVDVFADAETVGDPLGGAGTANATADATATTIVGVQDVGDGTGDFTFGNDATITASAGTLVDQVRVAATATTRTGAADASAVLSDLAGIRDDLSSAAGTGTAIVPDTASLANVIEVGDNGVIDTDAFATVSASATSVEGLADADSTITDVDAIAVDQVVIGNDGALRADAGITATTSAVTVDGIARANTDLVGIGGLTSEQVTVGDHATALGGYGIAARVDADLITTATNTGDGTADAATADGQLTLATGIQLGDGDGTAETTLSIGNAATVSGVADVTNAATASSVDGNTEAVAKLGADAAGTGTSASNAVLGIDLNDAAEIGSDGTILAQALVDLDATATTQAGVAGAGTAGAYAGAELVAGLDIDMANTDTTSIGADGTITALAQVDANAVASSTEGNADAEAGDLSADAAGLGSASSMTVVGLQANETLAIGDAGTINADASVDLVADAASISGGADADARLFKAAALEQSETFTIGANGTIDADSVITGLADADTVGNAAGDTATADAVATANTGASTISLSIGDNGTFTASADSSQTATATLVAGGGSANAQTVTNIGLQTNGATAIGADGSVRGEALSESSARAESTAEDAVATADATTTVGLNSDGALTVGAGGGLTGVTDIDLTATAITVGNDVTNDLADANATGTYNIALSLDVAGTTIGATGTVIGDADLDASASASAVEGDTTADVDFGLAMAIDLSGQTLSIGDGGTIGANSRVGTTASASTTDGDAAAAIDVDTIAGLGDGNGTVIIGSSGVVDADAVAVNTATAASIDADTAVVNATIDNDSVTAINLTSLTTGSNGAIDADASSTQTASASNVGDPGASDGSASAAVAANDDVYGITSTLVTVGGDASQLTASATLSGSATATTMSGSSTATAGDQFDVVGLNNASNVVVGDSATAGMAFQAVSNLTANATSIEDNATAQVGTVTVYGTGTGITALTGADVTGVDNSNITVGEDAGTILASASSTLNATAATNGTDGGNIDATAVVATTADGLLASAVSVGDDGNLTAAATLNGTATATNIGDVADTDDDAYAQIQLNADGLQQTSAETITIGASGNVIGQALVDGGASATTVSGSAEAKADLDAFGLNLDDIGADITIGEAGNISGLAVVGELAGGVLSDQIDILATANLEDATAITNLQAAGISGVDGGTLLTAGPSDGDVTGQALAGANLVARTIGDPASTTATTDNAIATLQSSTISGIENVDILGGMVGSNLVRGTAFGDFDVLAESVKGAATGSSTATSYGVFDADGDGNITLSGNVRAIAQLSNTVTARTIEGNATATATGDAIGLGGYSVTIIGSGSMTASASNTSRSLAESVGGRAGA